ncbi:MAG: ParB/RepB/Spo0J family partition protein [Deltaproteobacteria bacterium]|nr:ParB/RepB/Spo0J family partition protein [Deltaproteobacteria bacterium]
MTTNAKKGGRKALGRGLSSLISTPVVSLSNYKDEKTSALTSAVTEQNLAKEIKAPVAENKSEEKQQGGVTFLDIKMIINNPAQPRKQFIESEIAELAETIKTMGVLQPLIVRPSLKSEEQYEIVAGERRWRASKKVGLTEVPVIIKDLSDWESMEIALVENVQRSNLNPIDEAKAYQGLMDSFSLSQQDVAERIGKDRATVANLVRILKLSDEIQTLIQEEKLTTGHAKALLSVKDERAQLSLAKKAVEDSLSVRALEQLVSQSAPLDGSKKAALKGKEGINAAAKTFTDFPELVEKMRRKMGTKVLIKHHNSGRGKIELQYFSEQELDRLVQLLS